MTRRRSIGQSPPQHAQAVTAGSLGMELDAEDALALDCRHERAPVARLGQDRGLAGDALGPTGVRMHEVEVGARCDAGEEAVLASTLDLVPADVRQRRRVGEPRRPTAEHAKRLGAVLVAGLEQELQAEADAQERPAHRDPAQDRVDQPGPREPVHRRGGRADSRYHERIRGVEAVGVSGDRDASADRGESLVDGHEVARAIVHDRDPEPDCALERVRAARSRHPAAPFVEATPLRRGSIEQAARMARARALNAASARWWSFRPVPRTWSVNPPVRLKASSACSIIWVGSPPIRSPRNGRSITA
jgi:hypothetical protein